VATFVATPLGDGTWSVESSFKPHALDHLVFGFFGVNRYDVRGSASSTVPSLAPGATVEIGVTGMYFRGEFLKKQVRADLWLVCSFSVDAAGHVAATITSLQS